MSDDDMIRREDALDAMCKGPRTVQGRIDAIRAIPAAHVTVKPMEWLEIRHGQYFEARVIGILYSVRLGTDGISRWQAGHMGTWRDAPTIEAAKADAQADYDARIRSALTAKPSPDVAELVDMTHSLIAMVQHAIGPGRDVFIEPDTGRKLSDARAALARLHTARVSAKGVGDE